MTSCPGCRRCFTSLNGLDTHRRSHRAPAGCRYDRGEPRVGYRPGWLSGRRPLPYWRS